MATQARGARPVRGDRALNEAHAIAIEEVGSGETRGRHGGRRASLLP